MSMPTTPFTIVSITPAEESWKPSLKARARVRIADIVTIELEVLELRTGLFVAAPSRKQKGGGSDGWVPLVEIASDELRKEVFKSVRDEYTRLEERAKETAAAPAPPAIEPEFPEPNDLPF